MSNPKRPQIEFLDHIAIVAADMEQSARWYEEVLGLVRFQPEKWKPYPLMMHNHRGIGVAIFPVRGESEGKTAAGKARIGLYHYAFRVQKDPFDAFRQFFKREQIPFEYQNHHYFESLYLHDPDDNKVELTCFIPSSGVRLPI
ncbi:MAG: VOC family protein [Bacteroidota bacterium]